MAVAERFAACFTAMPTNVYNWTLLCQLNQINILATWFLDTHYQGRSEGECLQHVLAAVMSSRSFVSVYQRENRRINVRYMEFDNGELC
jgi:hypothetical protein